MPIMTQQHINWACDTIGDLLRDWHRLNKENEQLKAEIQRMKGADDAVGLSIVDECTCISGHPDYCVVHAA